MGLFDVFNPAGGLFYHSRAARHVNRRWRPFRANIERWLHHWQPPEPHLILVGPSAGYTLPITWLATFEKLTILEPDPFACWLLRRKLTIHARTNHCARMPEYAFITSDHFVSQPARWIQLVASSGRSAILFSNFLGQLPHLLGAAAIRETAEIKAAVCETVKDRSWASYHDRVSSSVAPNVPLSGLSTAQRLTGDELEPLYAHSRTSVTLVDHDTDDLFPRELAHQYFSWELTSGYFHLIEAVQHTSS